MYRKERKRFESRGDAALLSPGQRWLRHWFLPTVLDIRRLQRNLRAEEINPGIGFNKFAAPILAVNAKKLAVIAMSELFGLCIKEPDGVVLTRASRNVGRAVLAEAQIALWQKKALTEKEEGVADNETTIARLFKVQKRYKLTSEKIQWFSRLNDPETIFADDVLVHVGSRLIFYVYNNSSAAGYDTGQFQFAFKYTMVNRGGRKTKVIRLSEDVLKTVADDHKLMEQLSPVYPPMTVPPFEWKDNRGGYIELKTGLIKKSTKAQRQALKDAEPHMESFYECLATLGKTPLRVDREALAVVKALFDEGGGVLNIPRRNDWEIGARLPDDATAEQIAERKREAAILHDKNVKLYSERCLFNAIVGMASRVQHWPSLYFPHNCDSRSRCYPIPMYLNHHGDDLPRGMLEFSEAVPCDSEGMRNIAIHAANQWKHGGLDKMPFDDRVQWTMDHLHEIVGSAHDPLQNRWWMGAKKPLQFLQACRALRDPSKASHVMFGIDGTFNGMQHYSAMSRDAGCAALANLTDADSPSVPYKLVADRVVAILSRSDHPLAARLVPHIDADMVKQPAMTKVYGVTGIGAREQIGDKIADLGFEGKEWFAAAKLVADTTLAAIGDLFAGAVAYMDYLKDIARVIAKAGHPVTWETALGFPVVQSYRQDKTCVVNTAFGYLRVAVDASAMPVKVSKQSTACPPNFIHSVDATHLLMTARACSRGGIAFAGVHDGYKTHAQHGRRLGQFTREQFVALHDGPGPLFNAVNRWRELYPDLTIPEPPDRGTFDIREVLSSRYFFS